MSESDHEKISAFISKLKTKKLPVLDASISQIEAKLKHQNVNFEELANLIYLDPMCLVNFLACANDHKDKVAPRIEKNIKTAKHASMLLGLVNVENCIKQLSPLTKYKKPPVVGKIEKIAYNSLHSAYQARNLARLLRQRDSNDIFLAAMLSELPELLIWSLDELNAQKYENFIYKQDYKEEDAQLLVFGFTFNDLSRELSEVLHLPELYLEALETDVLDEAKKNIRCIKLANKLTRIASFGWYYKDMDRFLVYAEMFFPYNQKRLIKEFHQTALELANNCIDTYSIHLPAIYLLYTQREKVRYYPVIDIEAPVVAKSKATSIDKTIVKPSIENKKRSTQEKVNQGKSLLNLESAINIPTLVNLTVNNLSTFEGIRQVLLLLPDNERANLTVRISKGSSKIPTLNTNFALGLNEDIFYFLMKKPQTVFFNPMLKQAHPLLMTKVIEEQLPFKYFSAKSFFHQNKAIGIFFIAHKDAENKDLHQQFKQLMIRFEQHLATMS